MNNVYLGATLPHETGETRIKVVTSTAYDVISIVASDPSGVAVVHLDTETAYAVALSLLVAIKDSLVYPYNLHQFLD